MNIAVFASGNGSNAENIANYLRQENAKGKVSLIVTNKKDAGVIDRAKRLGIECVVATRSELENPEYVLGLLESHNIGLIVLAGYLLKVPKFMVEAYPDRIINIHPALLPKFGGKGMYGHHVHEAVVAAGEKETGITIHYVNEHYDEGAPIFQAKFEVLPEYTAEDVEARIHELEYRHFPVIVKQLTN